MLTYHSELMEDPLTARNEKVPYEDDKIREEHNSEDGPKPV